MGVVSGRFLPLQSYAAIQAEVIAARDESQDHFEFQIRLPGGQSLPAVGGVQLLDCSAELGPDEIEIHVLGVGYPLYAEVFPNLVTAYEAGPQNAG